MASFGWLLPLAVAVFVFDRLMRSAERRGWVYWRTSRRSSTRMGSAMLTVQSILEPDKEHVVEERAREEAYIDVAGDDEPPDPAAPGTTEVA